MVPPTLAWTIATLPNWSHCVPCLVQSILNSAARAESVKNGNWMIILARSIPTGLNSLQPIHTASPTHLPFVVPSRHWPSFQVLVQPGVLVLQPVHLLLSQAGINLSRVLLGFLPHLLQGFAQCHLWEAFLYHPIEHCSISFANTPYCSSLMGLCP